MKNRKLEKLPEIHRIVRTVFTAGGMQRWWSNPTPEMFYVIKGKYSLEIGQNLYPVVPGDLLLIPPETPHRSFPELKSGIEQVMIIFSWSAEKFLLENVTIDKLQKMSPSAKNEIAKFIDSMRAEYANGSAFDILTLRSRMHSILLLILGQLQKEEPLTREKHEPKKKNLLIDDAKRYLEEHYTEPVALKDIARQLGVSSFYLSRTFSQDSNFSLFSYLNSLRLEKAKELLEEGRLNISEAAYAVGFNNKSYFTRSFKKYFGKTPNTIR